MSVAASNALTRRWAAALADGPTVLSGAGVWPLLALLAAAAEGPGRDELAAAAGVPAAEGASAAAAVLAALQGPGVRSGAGVWRHASAPPTPWWVEHAPPGTDDELTGDPETDRARLDAWVADRTGGLLRSMPVTLRPELRVLLASALAVRTSWRQPFEPSLLTPAAGPWRGRTLRALSRSGTDRSPVRLAEGPLTLVRVEGDAGVDVHLALGSQDAAAAPVLTGALEALDGERPVRPAGPADAGAAPGLLLEEVPSADGRPLLEVELPAFSVAAGHDLLARADVFGLGAVSDPRRGHLPRLSATPLAVGQARQDVVAEFSATGFEAAAVTSAGAVLTSAPTGRAEVLRVRLDRPFAFVATQRGTGLVLVCGWVDDGAVTGLRG